MASAIDPTAVSDCQGAAARGSADFNPHLRLPWLRLAAEPQGTVRWSHGSLLCPFRLVGERSDPVSAASRRRPIGHGERPALVIPDGWNLRPNGREVKPFRVSGAKSDRMLQAARRELTFPPDTALSGASVHSPFFSLAASSAAV